MKRRTRHKPRRRPLLAEVRREYLRRPALDPFRNRPPQGPDWVFIVDPDPWPDPLPARC